MHMRVINHAAADELHGGKLHYRNNDAFTFHDRPSIHHSPRHADHIPILRFDCAAESWRLRWRLLRPWPQFLSPGVAASLASTSFNISLRWSQTVVFTSSTSTQVETASPTQSTMKVTSLPLQLWTKFSEPPGQPSSSTSPAQTQ